MGGIFTKTSGSWQTTTDPGQDRRREVLDEPLRRRDRGHRGGAEEDDRRQAYQKRAAIDHQSKLRLQIERNKVRRAEEKQAEFLEKKYIEKVEAEHAYIVANEGGRCNIHHPIKSMKWFT